MLFYVTLARMGLKRDFTILYYYRMKQCIAVYGRHLM